MKRLSKVLAVLAMSCIATQAFANTSVTCQATSTNSKLVFSFVVVQTQSARLIGTLTYIDASLNLLFPGSRVAQFVNNPFLMYIMLDDSSQNILFVFSATPALQSKDGSFHGTMTPYANGQPSSIIPLKCTTATI